MKEYLFFNDKPVKAMIVLLRKRGGNQLYTSQLSREIETTYAHAVKVINLLQEKGYIEKRKDGRKNFLSLTGKGVKVAEKLEETVDVLEDLEA